MLASTHSKRMAHWTLLLLAVVLGVTSQSILASADQQENSIGSSKLATQDEAQPISPKSQQGVRNLLIQLRELERLRKLLMQRFGTREAGELDGSNEGIDSAEDAWDLPNEALEKRAAWHKRRQWIWTPGSGYQEMKGPSREDPSSKGNQPIRFG